MSIGSDLLSSVTGATDKACIVVHDVRSQGTACLLYTSFRPAGFCDAPFPA